MKISPKKKFHVSDIIKHLSRREWMKIVLGSKTRITIINFPFNYAFTSSSMKAFWTKRRKKTLMNVENDKEKHFTLVSTSFAFDAMKTKNVLKYWWNEILLTQPTAYFFSSSSTKFLVKVTRSLNELWNSRYFLLL